MKNCIILFSTADWDEPYWTNKQHTAKNLAENGFDIIYVESIGLRGPRLNSSKDVNRIFGRIKTGLKCLVSGGRQVNSKIRVISPLSIPNPKNNVILRKINELMITFMLKREKRYAQFNNVILWSYHPYVSYLINKIEFDKVIYHCVDDLSQVPGIDPISFRNAEDLFLKKCNRIFVTTKSLLERCICINENTEYYSNVVDYNHFSIPKEITNTNIRLIKSSNKPKIVYHGVISDFKIDLELLYNVMNKCDNYEFFIIGEEREGQKSNIINLMEKLDNVHFLGYISYEDIPSYLSFMDVGILPSLLNEYTYSMFPMKYYEYVAAKLPVVSTPLGFTEYTKGPWLRVAKNADNFKNAIKQSILDGRLSDEESRNAVGDNTWQGRTQKMLESIYSGS
ncbi:glycosyltransferase [Vibrio spartinae]|uniref:Teichuronic acid biosynthesis glycosyltransferase TuaH n=1 Tax=Vibrio spartinae TaxID=1918945 RepID=A0ABX6QVD6_9VIBR|nr:glycosyltransferase [Vibrio spartinae]QMV12965.1 Putative teichuronic acid biosynthesis glycosyltransferase TuaH [Vibrio spartinae]